MTNQPLEINPHVLAGVRARLLADPRFPDDRIETVIQGMQETPVAPNPNTVIGNPIVVDAVKRALNGREVDPPTFARMVDTAQAKFTELMSQVAPPPLTPSSAPAAPAPLSPTPPAPPELPPAAMPPTPPPRY